MGRFHYKQCWTASNITKNSIRDRYKPISKNTKTLNLYSIILKVNNWSSESWIFDEQKIKNIKIQLPAISMHVRLPQSLISMSITKTIYKSVVFCAIGEVFATGCFTFNYRQRYSRTDNSVLTPRYWFPILFSLSVLLKYKLPVPVYCYCKKFGKIKNAPFSNWKKIEIRENMTESQENR